jgi:hypothetical protein
MGWLPRLFLLSLLIKTWKGIVDGDGAWAAEDSCGPEETDASKKALYIVIPLSSFYLAPLPRFTFYLSNLDLGMRIKKSKRLMPRKREK